MQQVRVRLGFIVYYFNNGIGIIGMGFISNNFMRTLLECWFMFCWDLFGWFSWNSFFWYVFGSLFPICFMELKLGLTSEPSEQHLDFPVTIPIPFDVLCFLLCYCIVGFTGMEESFVSGKVSEMLYWGFIMCSVTTIFFMYYIIFSWNSFFSFLLFFDIRFC